MIFNAPNVASPGQLNELWVSTPPPDLVHLFSEKSFENLSQWGYAVKIKKITTGSEVFSKNLAAVLGRPYAQFPRSFAGGPRMRARWGAKAVKNRLKAGVTSLGGILSHFPVLRPYENEYGLIITMRRT
jgi:hypothetical protein